MTDVITHLCHGMRDREALRRLVDVAASLRAADQHEPPLVVDDDAGPCGIGVLPAFALRVAGAAVYEASTGRRPLQLHEIWPPEFWSYSGEAAEWLRHEATPLELQRHLVWVANNELRHADDTRPRPDILASWASRDPVLHTDAARRWRLVHIRGEYAVADSVALAIPMAVLRLAAVNR